MLLRRCFRIPSRSTIPFHTRRHYKLQTRKYTTPAELIHTSLSSFEQFLNVVHVASDHSPWWIVIIGTTISLRLAVTLPIALIQNKRSERFSRVLEYIHAWERTLSLKFRGEGVIDENAKTKFSSLVIKNNV